MANYTFSKMSIAGNSYEPVDWYGTCSTAAATKAKTVSISGFSSEQKHNGCRVIVKFTYAQNASGALTLNVSNTGAHNICQTTATGAAFHEWAANQIVSFVFYDNVWVIDDGAHASTDYYGKTRLSNSITDTSSVALTPKAVYDAGYATTSQIPTKVSDLTNDSGYLTLSTLPIWPGSMT